MIITSKNNEIIKTVSKLVKSPKFRKESGQFTAEGVRLCRDGIISGLNPEMFIYTAKAKEKYYDDFLKIDLVSKRSFEVTDDIFEKISDTQSPLGFFCVFNMLDKCEIMYTINNQGNYIALENLQDPSNLGTILRTAEALGIDGVIISGNSCDVFSPKVVRGSMGAVFRIPICVVEDFPSYISQLTESGVETYASTPRNAEKITDVIFSGGVMLIGNEGNGLSEEAVSACKKKVMIQMSGRAESLNAASAASILMWEMFRRI